MKSKFDEKSKIFFFLEINNFFSVQIIFNSKISKYFHFMRFSFLSFISSKFEKNIFSLKLKKFFISFLFFSKNSSSFKLFSISVQIKNFFSLKLKKFSHLKCFKNVFEISLNQKYFSKVFSIFILEKVFKFLFSKFSKIFLIFLSKFLDEKIKLFFSKSTNFSKNIFFGFLFKKFL
jgi:hypothetical protein